MEARKKSLDLQRMPKDMQEVPIQPVSGSSVETVVEDPGYDLKDQVMSVAMPTQTRRCPSSPLPHLMWKLY